MRIIRLLILALSIGMTAFVVGCSTGGGAEGDTCGGDDECSGDLHCHMEDGETEGICEDEHEDEAT